MSDGTPALALGTLVAGKLRIVRTLGVGGMGTVYEVEHVLTRHRRALKLLHPELAANQHVVARFLREASAAGRIGSPHIVETFDAGTLETGEPYLLMEMLDGRSLADILKDTGPIAERQAVTWLSQACDGVQAAHDAGIIHRDLKPDNLFIEREGRVKILDFGISKFDEALTGERQLTGALTLGTPYYMAPEQTSQSANVDRRADVYALGVVLYECVTGKRPFEAETYPQLVVRIHLGEYEPASSVCGTSALVDGIIAKAMARKPEARFQTPAELAAALRDVVRATERTGSPFDSTQRAFDLTALLEQQKPADLALAAAGSPPRSPPLPRREPGASGQEATLLSAGSDPAGAGRAPRSRRSWLTPGLALTAVSLAVWWATSRDRSAAEPRELSVVAAPARAPVPNAASAAVESAAPHAASAGSTMRSPSRPPLLAVSGKSNKSGSRAQEHALEEENPFR